MLRLVFITSSLPHGGAERHSLALMHRLGERGHQCHAAYLKENPGGPQAIRLRGAGTVRCLHVTRYLDRRALTELAGLIAHIAPSAIVAANPYPLMYAALARGLFRAQPRLLVTYHSTRLLNVKERLQMFAHRPLFWGADCTVFVCEHQRRYWRQRAIFSRRNEVIYNGVDANAFCDTWCDEERTRIRGRLGLSPSDYVIGLSAWLRPEKNHVQLVDAVALLRQMGVPARALMIGEGETRSVVEARARALGIQKAVVITGYRSDVRPCIAACDVMVLCSTTETFSLAALEAMAMGKPVIHSDVGGASEMISSGWNGFLFPVGDTETLVERLAMLSDRAVARRMGERAREVVLAHFAEGTMIDRYERLLMGLCQVGPRLQRRALQP